MFLRICAQSNLWLPFMILAQLHNYPSEQIKNLVHAFKSPTLLEHILHSVVNDFQVSKYQNKKGFVVCLTDDHLCFNKLSLLQLDDQNLMRDRDSRKAYLSRIGVRTSLENINMTDSMCSSIYSRSSCGSTNSSSGSDFLEIDLLNTKTTLLQVLIKSHNSRDPPRALLQACQLYRCPLLAILATSYEVR